MDSKCDAVLPNGSQAVIPRHSGTSVSNTVFGFNLSENQFQILNSNQTASSPRSTEQHEEGLTDPRTTRQRRWAIRGTANQETKTEEASLATVQNRTAQGTSSSGNFVNPVAVDYNSSQSIHSFSAGPSENFAVSSVGPTVHYLLEPGVGVSGGDSLLYGDLICNKRISHAGPERSAGRPGHTPSRRILACGENIEDSCAGPDWSAGRPGTMPFGARTSACLPTQAACISGPYGNASQQTHDPGCNTREEQSFVTTPPRDQQPRQTTTSQQQMSTSGGHAASDRASPAKVALHPRRPPYFCGGT